MKTDRTVIVTGAGGAMGSVIVTRFLANGDTVIATDNGEEPLEAMAGKQDADNRLHTIVGDVSKDADCAKVAELARSVGGKVDVLVNVAGFFPVQSFMEMTSDDWRKIIDINLTGPALMAKAVLPLMVGRGWGRIINFGSASLYIGVAGQAHYVAAKGGVVGLSRSLAREFGRDGITVNVVAPGVTVNKEGKAGPLPKEILDQAITARCIQRPESPEDLVGTTFFLASPDADFVTGQTIIVDGGTLML